MSLASLIVRIGADLGDYDRKLAQAERRIADFGAKLQQVGQTLAVGITAPIVAFGAASIKAAADMEALERGLAAATKSAEPLNAQLARLKEVAKLPGLGFTEAVQGSINLQAAGFSAGLAERALKSFGNALATVGKGRAELDGVILALTQIAAKGKVSAEEINQLQERLPQIRQAMKDAFGTADTEALKAMGIDSQVFITKIIEQFERLKPVTGGLKNDFENLRDNVQIALADTGKAFAPFASAFVNQVAVPMIEKLKLLGTEFGKMDKDSQASAVALGAVAAAAPLATIALGALVEKVILLKGAFLSSPAGIAAFAAGLTLSALAAKSLKEELEDMRHRMQAAADTEMEKATKANTHFGRSTQTLRQDLANLVMTYEPAGAGTNALANALKNAGNSATVAAVEVAEFTNKVRGQTAESAVLHAMLSQLESEHRKLTSSVASSRLNHEQLTAGMEQFRSEMSSGIPVIEETVGANNKLILSTKQLREQFPLLASAIEDSVEIARQQLGSLVPQMDEIRRKFPTLAAEIDGANQRVADSMKKSTKQQKEALREVSTIITNMSQDIARMIINWESAGKTFVGIAKRMGESILSNIIQHVLTATGLVQKLTGLLSKIPGLGGIFGTASSTAASTAGGVAGAAGSAGGGVASAAGAASSGIMGAINLATGIGSLVSGVVGNFQMSGMNKSLDVLVQHTLQTTNIVRDTLNTANTWWPYLKSNNEALWVIRDTLMDPVARVLEEVRGILAQGRELRIVMNGQEVARATLPYTVRELKLAGA